MAAIALRVPTTCNAEPNLAGGHCYILFDRPTITAANLIAEKVRSEYRKLRAGGTKASSIHRLVPDAGYGGTPAEEQMGIAKAQAAFKRGDWLLIVDGQRITDLSTEITLRRNMGITFEVPTEEVARFLATPHAPRETVGHGLYRRRARS